MRPRLARHAALRWNEARGEWLLLLPEQVVVLNETAAAVLSRCDGSRSPAEIARQLGDTYDGVELADVEELLRDLVAQRIVESA